MSTIDPQLLANLAALRPVDPGLVERITWPCNSEHVSWIDDDLAEYRVHRTWHRLSLEQDEIDRVLAGYDPDRPVLLLGLGLGEILESVAHRARAPVHAWERDPWLLRQVLSRQPWGERLDTVRFHLTTDLLGLLGDDTPAQVLRHPLLGSIYRQEDALLRDGVGERRALLGLGGLFVDDVADALRDEGYSVIPWDLAGWSQEELAHVAEASEAEVAVAVNYTHGLAEACADLGVPLTVWEIDPSTDALPALPGGSDGAASRGATIGTWRASHVAEFRRAGFSDVRFVPLAANPRSRVPMTLSADDVEHYGADVIFVGASMVDQGLSFRRRLIAAHVLARGGDPSAAIEEAERAIESVLDAQREDFSTYRVPELLAEALPMFASPQGEAVRAALDGARPDALLGEMAAADKRITYVANLGQVGIHVWGDEGWTHATPYGAIHRGPAGHRGELNLIYSTDAIHLDIGRLYQGDIVTMRVFDVLACGGFCLAEWSPGLADLFEIGVELDAYRTLEEMLAKVGHWLEAGPEARRAVGARGRERVLRDHTIRARISSLLSPAPSPPSPG